MNYRRTKNQKFWWYLLSAPVLWLPLLGILLLDLLVTIYQALCFPIYKLEKVKRSAYILVRDRNKLSYLNLMEKIGCMYCGYANGFFLYAKEIAGRTEKYWCGIMHEAKPGFLPQTSQIEQDFARFGDEVDCRKKYGL